MLKSALKKQNKNKNSYVMNVNIRFKKTYSVNAKSADFSFNAKFRF